VFTSSLPLTKQYLEEGAKVCTVEEVIGGNFKPPR